MLTTEQKENLIASLRRQASIVPAERESCMRMISQLSGEPVKPFKTVLKRKWKS